MPTNFICLYAPRYNTLRNIFIIFSNSYIQSVITGANIALWGRFALLTGILLHFRMGNISAKT